MQVTKWDRRFLELSELVSTWSRDPSTKCGAVIVRSDNTVLSLGYNGFPRGMKDDAELYDDRPTKYARTVHAEMNAMLTAHGQATGCTLYTWPFISCERCAVHMIQGGITRAVCPVIPPSIAERWAENRAKTLAFFAEAGMECREVDLEEWTYV